MFPILSATAHNLSQRGEAVNDMALTKRLRRAVLVPRLAFVSEKFIPARARNPIERGRHYAWALLPVGTTTVDVFKELPYSVTLEYVVCNS